MAHASYVTSAQAMALGAPQLVWFCAATWQTFAPPLTLLRQRAQRIGYFRNCASVGSGDLRAAREPPRRAGSCLALVRVEVRLVRRHLWF